MSGEFVSQWKELLVYREDGKQFAFDCVWGVEPHAVYVPNASYWPKVTPDWMRLRRPEILALLHEFAGDRLIIRETNEGYPEIGRPRLALFVAATTDGLPAGAWVAVLLDPDEEDSPDSSWGDADRARFLEDHAGRMGTGVTPASAIEDLKRHRLDVL
ncbi:MAG: hypothetical protein HOV76_20060 [Hamadaea sp.]|nr:hypothetical protein [Hamadaea sp.]